MIKIRTTIDKKIVNKIGKPFIKFSIKLIIDLNNYVDLKNYKA